MPLFAIELTTVAIVEADDEDAAMQVARDEQRSICADTLYMDLAMFGQVTCREDLIAHGWDEACIPYGGDGNTRIRDLLAATPE